MLRLILVLVAFAPLVNAEPLEKAVEDYLTVAEEPPKKGWKVTGQLGLTVTDGNSDTITFTFGIEAVKEFDPWKVIIKENSIYSEDDGNETANEHILIVRGERKISERGALFAQILFEHDSQEDLDYRLILTLGYKHHIIKKDKFNLWGEVGGGVVHEEFSTFTDTSGSAHVGVNWVWQITKQLLYTQSFLLLPNLSDTGEFLFIAESVFSTPLSDRLDARLTITDKFDSDPAAGRKENDLTVTLTIAIKFTKVD